MAMPLPQVCNGLTAGFAYPTETWQAKVGSMKTDGWDQAYMEQADVPRSRNQLASLGCGGS